MSYAIVRPRVRSAPVPPLLPIMPLAQVPESGMSATTKKVIVIVVVLLLIVGLLYLMDERRAPKRNPSRLRKASTAELAKRLYDRLERNGRAHETTMRSLAQISRNR